MQSVLCEVLKRKIELYAIERIEDSQNNTTSAEEILDGIKECLNTVEAQEKNSKNFTNFQRALATGVISGPGYGTRIKLVKICPMFGTETQVCSVLELYE